MALHPHVVSAPVPPQTAEALRRWFEAFPPYPYDDSHPSYEAVVQAALPELPQDLTDLVSTFRHRLGAAGALRLTGLPVGEIAPTPSVPHSEIRLASTVEPLVLGLAMLVGAVVPLPGAHGDDWICNLYPIRDGADDSISSNVILLDLHTDLAFSDRCDAFLLFCLRDGSAPPPPTLLCDIGGAWERLDDKDRLLLEEPGYCIPVTSADGSADLTPPAPVATAWRGQRRFNYIWDLVGATAAHSAALEHLRGEMRTLAGAVTLAPGDCLFVDNVHMVHGRTRQRPNFDGRDRWVQKCFIQSLAGTTEQNGG